MTIYQITSMAIQQVNLVLLKYWNFVIGFEELWEWLKVVTQYLPRPWFLKRYFTNKIPYTPVDKTYRWGTEKALLKLITDFSDIDKKKSAYTVDLS